nr:MAG TPA: hypothetical protein [Caudoviricetes sp.]
MRTFSAVNCYIIQLKLFIPETVCEDSAGITT